MNRLRFVMVGGFLGAGKTTTLARLARFYQGRGQKVGLVTNDQAENLVDTTNLRAQGFAVEEIAGACFCCRFNDLVEKVGSLEVGARPDVILAEPVGSCTDLVATVVQPLKDLYGLRFEVAPYAVLFKPAHGLGILDPQPSRRGGFSPKAEYIFRKQLEEADALVVNRIDEMAPAEIERVVTLVTARFPGVPVLKISAKTGTSFETLPALLDQEGNFGRKILDIDYDTYAEGEAELGWLNATYHVTASSTFDLDALLLAVVGGLQVAVADQGEVAHLKAIGLSDSGFGVANLVGSAAQAELSLPSRARVPEVELIVNARVALDPAILEAIVTRVVAEVARQQGVAVLPSQLQSFRPGRPTPTHRYAEAK
jgi:G3E family GTPase